jgi:hypothetical protein
VAVVEVEVKVVVVVAAAVVVVVAAAVVVVFMHERRRIILRQCRRSYQLRRSECTMSCSRTRSG